MNLERLKKLMKGQAPYRLEQAADAVFRRGVTSFQEITTLPADLRKKLAGASLLSFTLERVRNSKDGRTIKAAMIDNRFIGFP